MKDPQAAFGYFQKAQVADPAHAGTAVTWMAVLRDQENDPAEAESFFKQALSLDEAGSPEIALTTELFASFLQRQHHDDEAKGLRDQAQSLRTEIGQRSAAVQRSSQVTSYHVGGGVTPPQLVSKVEPVYSEEARIAKYQGTVLVSTVIGTDGSAQSMRVVRGLGLGLDDEALKAIAQWKFTPGSRNGGPVPVQATIEVNFRLL
jgi:TonB family protein